MLCRVRSPSIARASSLLIDSPRPTPCCVSLVRCRSICTNGSNTRLTSAALIPTPLSVTRTSTIFALALHVSFTVPPASVNLIAFVMRLRRICCNLSASAATARSCSGGVTVNVIRFALACRAHSPSTSARIGFIAIEASRNGLAPSSLATVSTSLIKRRR